METPDDEHVTKRKHEVITEMTHTVTTSTLQQLITGMNLPQPTIDKFSGDATCYRSFMRAFEARIENKVSSYSDKLYYLEQFTSGPALDLVNSCIHISDAKKGFREAKSLLEEHYGDDYLVAIGYIDKLLGFPNIKSEDGFQLRRFAVALKTCFNALTDINRLTDINYPQYIRTLMEKLPERVANRWRREASDIRSKTHMVADFWEFLLFVEREARIATDPVYSKRPTSSRHVSTHMTTPRHAEPSCTLCFGKHLLVDCEKFRVKDYESKRQFVIDKRLCFGCLQEGHRSRDCRQKELCKTCNKRHPTTMHVDHFQRSTSPPTVRSNTAPGPRTSTSIVQSTAPPTSTFGATPTGFLNQHSTSLGPHTFTSDVHSHSDIMMSIIPVKIRQTGSPTSAITYAFLDSGSSGCFMTDDLQQQLNIEGQRTKIYMTTMHGHSCNDSTIVSGLQISDLYGKNVVDLPITYSRPEIPIGKDRIPSPSLVQRWNHLRHLDIPDIFANVDIGLLLGSNCPKATEPIEVVPSQDGGPYAILTRFGWTVTGPLTMELDGTSVHAVTCNRLFVSEAPRSNVSHQIAIHDDLKNVGDTENLKKMFEYDFSENFAHDDDSYSQDDRKFLKIVNDGVMFDDGHYVLPLPFRNDANITSNKHLTTRRAMSLRRKLIANPAYKSDYETFMKDLLLKGYARKIPEDELTAKDGKEWYIPHHGVYHPKKPGKIRVVFDCSATQDGISLNDCLLPGPNLTNSIIGVLTRFRQEQVVIIADVEAMFHQVRVSPNDWNYLRFLWWPDGNIDGKLEDYQMVVHLFGATSSPSCANFALRKTADDHTIDPLVRQTIYRNFYVDDCLKSEPNTDVAVRLLSDLRQACAAGGFNLTKVLSNHREVIESIPEADRAKEVKTLDLAIDDLPSSRTLGVIWCIEDDTFTFQHEFKSYYFTRRGLLSMVSSLHDPLGFICPVVLVAKRCLQDLCGSTYGWDDAIPDQYVKKMTEWQAQIPMLQNFSVDRCLKPTDFEDVQSRQIHCFADGSSYAYGCVVYLRQVDNKGHVHVSFLIAKSRVAPKKPVTIPRLELTAATVSSKVGKMMERELDVPVDDIIFWTDSTTVLRYIHNDARQFKVFVANRLSQIHDNSKPSQWRYVNTKDNPADIASRGCTPEDLMASKIWLHGPDFLSKPEHEWPTHDVPTRLHNDPEVKINVTATTVDQADPLMMLCNHYSSWHKLTRALGWLIKFKDLLRKWVADRKRIEAEVAVNTHDSTKIARFTESRLIRTKKLNCKSTMLSLDDVNVASLQIIKTIQRHAFPDEVSGKITRQSSLASLSPVMVDGVLCVGGRLKKANIPFQEGHPIILPRKNHVTDLVIRHCHEKLGHAGRNHTLADLRNRYWIVHANSNVRRILRGCVKCKRIQGTVLTQKMADLPSERVNPSSPFTFTGVDYFGPFVIKEGRKEAKRYGVVFTCLTMRAVHIEIANSLDTGSFINALRRFIARRGNVTEIRSDNGSNFVGSERELKTEISKWNLHQINDKLMIRNIRWKFNPPTGSHHGGVWERQIRTIRKILKGLLVSHGHRLSDEALHTVMCEVEAIINSRPLTTISDDPKDATPLTPNHILTLRTQWLTPPGRFQEADMFRKMWRRVQFVVDSFWKRWRKEYLHSLQERKKWQRPQENLSVDDIVLIADDNEERGFWKMGRVLTVYPDDDGNVRIAKVKTENGLFNRPISKLVLLLSK